MLQQPLPVACSPLPGPEGPSAGCGGSAPALPRGDDPPQPPHTFFQGVTECVCGGPSPLEPDREEPEARRGARRFPPFLAALPPPEPRHSPGPGSAKGTVPCPAPPGPGAAPPSPHLTCSAPRGRPQEDERPAAAAAAAHAAAEPGHAATAPRLLWAPGGGGGTLRSSLAQGRSRRCPRLLRRPPRRPVLGVALWGRGLTPSRSPLAAPGCAVGSRPAPRFPDEVSTRWLRGCGGRWGRVGRLPPAQPPWLCFRPRRLGSVMAEVRPHLHAHRPRGAPGSPRRLNLRGLLR